MGLVTHNTNIRISVIMTTNTQAGTLMIAEKGAQMILRQWASPHSHYNYNDIFK
jgi:hypothetical protein